MNYFDSVKQEMKEGRRRQTCGSRNFVILPVRLWRKSLLTKDLCFLSLKSRDVSPIEKWLNMTRKRWGRLSRTKVVFVKADVNRGLLKEVCK